jgi:glycosyltransferase involved in cell wall biosynthesis
MNNDKPLISVGMPVFNAENFIEQALASISGQTFEDWELIVCDNASTDRTQAICEAWVDRDPRISYTRNDRNYGAAYSYNRTFELASGKYFKWAAHDDLISANFLTTCIELLERHPDAVVAYGRTAFMDEAGVTISERHERHDLTAASPSARFDEMITYMGHCTPLHGLMCASALAQTQRHGAYPHADRVLLLELSLLGTLREASDAVYFLRQHARSSLRANPDTPSLWRWFDTSAKGSTRNPFFNLTFENLRAVNRSHIGPREKLRCHARVARFAWEWMAPRARHKFLRLFGSGFDAKRSTS